MVNEALTSGFRLFAKYVSSRLESILKFATSRIRAFTFDLNLKRLFRVSGFIVALILNALCLFAQDGHYWSEHHGTRSTLLNGTVIGSVDDLGTVYYNPARLAQIENPAFLLSGKIYQLDALKIENGAGDGLDLDQKRFGGSPNMVAGTFKLKFLEGHYFSYSFLTRHNFSSDYFVHNEAAGNIIEAWPGDELYGGEFRFQKNLKEDWLGLSWAYALNESMSIGVTNFVTVRNQDELLSTELQIYSSLDELASLHKTRKIGYNAYGLLWKFALAYKKGSLSAGLVVTTPKINISGSGETYYRDFYSGPKGIGDGKLKDVYITNYQNNLEAIHKTPFAIGIGAGIKLNKTNIHVSGEWYNHVSEYEIISSDFFLGQSNNREMQLIMIDELNPVLNFGLGIEYVISPKYSFFGSFATDFSAVGKADRQYDLEHLVAQSSTIQADMYHFGGGILLDTKWLEVTAGASYAFANQKVGRPFQFPETEADLSGPTEEANMNIKRWKFILGFSIPFVNKNKILEFDQQN